MYFGAFGVERRAKVSLPYCAGCADSAERVPMGLGRRFVVWLGLFILGIMVAPMIPGVRVLGVRGFLLIDAALAAAIVWGWALYGARPRGRQTSYYQPVHLRDFGRVLTFTNGEYGERVAAANRGIASIDRVDVPRAHRQGGSLAERLRSSIKAATHPSPRFWRTAERCGIVLIVVVIAYALLYYFHYRGR